MDKKALSGIIIVIIIIAIVLLLIGIFIAIAYQSGAFNKKEQQFTNITLYMMAQDTTTQESIDSNYILSYMDNTTEVIVSQGKLLKDAFTPSIVPSNKIIYLRCWNEDHYLNKVKKQFDGSEISKEQARIYCNADKMGTLSIDLIEGGLSQEINFIKTNITSDAYYKNLGMCFEWSPGIIRITREQQALCKNNVWLNWTKYYPENNTYEYLPEKTYRCGNNIENAVYEQCDSTLSDRCYLPETTIPSRFFNKVDSCSYTGKSLSPDESYEINLEVETFEYKNQLDFINIIFYDNDKKFNANTNKWEYLINYDSIDEGSKDINLRLNYTNGI